MDLNNKAIEEGVIPWSTVGYLVAKRTYCRRLDAEDPDSPTEEWGDVVDRVINASRKLGCGFTAEEESRLRGYIHGLKGSVAGRFLWQMGTETVDRLGLPSLQNCFSGDTQILTDKGSASLSSLEGTEFYVPHQGQWHKAYVKMFGHQDLNEIVFGMPTRSNYKALVHATGNHRWELCDGTVTAALKIGDRVKRQSVSNEFNVEGFKHGLIFGDGSLSYRYTHGECLFSIRLCGKKEAYKDLFDKYFYQPNCGGDPVAYYKANHNLKEVPEDGASLDYISSFILGWLAADGSTNPSGTKILSSQNHAAVEWLLLNAPYAGYCVTGINECGKDSNYGKRSAPLKKVSLRPVDESQYMEVKSIVPIGGDKVYCAVVPGVERFVLSNGLLTCNCAFVTVDEPVRPFVWTFDMLNVNRHLTR